MSPAPMVHHADIKDVSDVSRKKRKTKYSRNGCQHCKRMKVKVSINIVRIKKNKHINRLFQCDEALPTCTRCSKSSRSCVYPNSNSDDAQVPSQEINKQIQVSSPNSTHSSIGDFMDKLDQDIFLKIDTVLESLDTNLDNLQSSNSIDQIDRSIILTLEPYDKFQHLEISNDLLTTDIIYKIPLELFSNLNDHHEKCYLEVFYNEFSHIILPLEPRLDSNPIRDILLQYSLRKNYLFYAIIATGARLSYKRTHSDDDKRQYSKYLEIALEMLDDLVVVKDFIPNDVKDRNIEMSKTMEPLLLTILILTSDNASSMQHSWRGHLKGAKELLFKTFILKHFNHNSKILIFCKLWFTSFEILACLTAPSGGTIKDESEWKNLIFDATNKQELEVIERLDLVTKEGFNLLLGYHNKVLSHLVQLIELMRFGGKATKVVDEHYLESTLRLIQDFKDHQRLSMMKKIPVNAISFYRNSSTLEMKTISWYDACHESHTSAALLTIMTKILNVPRENSIVQILVRRILSPLGVLNGGYDHLTAQDSTSNQALEDDKQLFGLMLLQWPLLVAGLNSIDNKDRVDVESLFHLLTKLGSGSSKFAINKIKKAWNTEPNSEEVDFVTY